MLVLVWKSELFCIRNSTCDGIRPIVGTKTSTGGSVRTSIFLLLPNTRLSVSVPMSPLLLLLVLLLFLLLPFERVTLALLDASCVHSCSGADH